MKLKDTLHGEQTIDEEWVIDIINHPVFLRLKGINQYGYIEPFHPEAQTNRYEHSLGVFFLLRKIGVSKKEQLAGLMHDVSHTVFSHCIDYALDKKNPELQKYQDNTHEEYVENSALFDIIKKHGFSLTDVVEYKRYPALEKELPDLCADRIDYALRDACSFGVLKKEKARKILADLKFKDNTWFFSDFKTAKEFSFLFKKMNNDFYSAPWTGVMFLLVGDYIRYSLQNAYIELSDFYLTDREVIEKININLKNDKKLESLWQFLNNPQYVLDKNDYDFKVKTKSRIVDPLVMAYNEKKRYSEVDDIWKKVVEEEVKPKEYFIRYIK